ncbi:DUF3108 domain-containing protein [Massilia sp. erpn]|uniref:DUF3108 domain-containing protein n=1 Tax=Massilia sp. erpn TaxID=2738142 RepID=UPI002103A48D|nr:DUF3108 domain-containing protein [Massilia sp. erpn]UTY56600.1 DUF3108 domain-containing protein [Massilia sp. erpn]
MTMTHFKQALAASLLLTALQAPALAASEHPSIKRPFNLPPSADLQYALKARNHGLPLSGEASVVWRAGGGKYSILSEARSGLFGKVLENRSEGAVDDYGLAPDSYYEKRIRKGSSTTQFKRDSKTIEFADAQESYPLKGGEQDRTSAPWQLAAIARQAPEKFKPGSEWAFFVAGRRDAEAWTFKVVGSETLKTAMGDIEALHFSKAPPKRDKGQQVDLWLAPSLDWYPVRILFSEEDGDSFEQLLTKIDRK